MYKLELDCLYPAFIKSSKFAESVENIPNEAVKAAVMESGIGDNLDRCATGCIFYDFESGNLVEAKVRNILSLLNEEDYRSSFKAIGEVAEAYADWASSMEEKIDRVFQLEDQLETLAEIDRTAQEYQALLVSYAQKISTLA